MMAALLVYRMQRLRALLLFMLGGSTVGVVTAFVGRCSDRRPTGADFVYFLLGGAGEFYHDCTYCAMILCLLVWPCGLARLAGCFRFFCSAVPRSVSKVASRMLHVIIFNLFKGRVKVASLMKSDRWFHNGSTWKLVRLGKSVSRGGEAAKFKPPQNSNESCVGFLVVES